MLVGKPEGKRQLGRLRRRWEVSIRLNLREIGWGPVAGCCEHGNELSVSIKGGKFLD
jgi:hypothetical protein